MPVDLNEVARKLKERRPVGVDDGGHVTDRDPGNDGTRRSANGQVTTTLKPERFYV